MDVSHGMSLISLNFIVIRHIEILNDQPNNEMTYVQK